MSSEDIAAMTPKKMKYWLVCKSDNWTMREYLLVSGQTWFLQEAVLMPIYSQHNPYFLIILSYASPMTGDWPWSPQCHDGGMRWSYSLIPRLSLAPVLWIFPLSSTDGTPNDTISKLWFPSSGINMGPIPHLLDPLDTAVLVSIKPLWYIYVQIISSYSPVSLWPQISKLLTLCPYWGYLLSLVVQRIPGVVQIGPFGTLVSQVILPVISFY